MNELLRFLERLFTEGTIRLRVRPVLVPAERPQLERLLASAYAEHALSVAGPTPAFVPEYGVRAAQILADACWFLLSHDEPHTEVETCLAWHPGTLTPGQILSADLCLRYLPQIHRRARELDAADTLTRSLTLLLRQWPLSGVSTGLHETPLADLDLAGSPGLRLLYAERLPAAPDPAWVPEEGPTREIIDLVFDRKKLPVPRRVAPATTSPENP